MVREGQVLPADQQVNAGAERRHRHGRALGVPPGSAPAPRTGPRRVPRRRRAPHRHIERVIPHRVVGVVAELRGQLQRPVPGQPGSRHGTVAAEVHRPVPFVGVPGGEQRSGQLQHLRDVMPRPRRMRGPRDLQRRHVLLEQELLVHRVVVVMPAVGVRGRGQHIIDIGDVAARDRLHSNRPQHRLRRVRPDERRGVPQVRDVVRGDPADVHPGRAHQRQPRAGQPELGAMRDRFAVIRQPSGQPDDSRRETRSHRHQRSFPPPVSRGRRSGLFSEGRIVESVPEHSGTTGGSLRSRHGLL